jgi:trans-2,3-dihydro-3-hydroxyanthranilate isomerase
MRSYRYLHLDVFADRLFGGNQLAVFLDGRDLETATMQAIAKEMNFSETTFVLPPEDERTDVRLRIFTPADELPMAGHPTIGTAFAMAHAGLVEPGRARVIFGLGIGPTDVELTWTTGSLTFAWMTQRTPIFEAPLTDRAGAAASLRLSEDTLDESRPVQVVSCGVPYLLVPLRSRRAVDAAVFDPVAYERLQQASGLGREVCVYLFSTEQGQAAATAYSRMFGAGVGIAEDPATGSACGPLGCYLLHHKLVTPDEARRMISLQGVTMGRPSAIHIAVDQVDGLITRVRVGGEAVMAGTGTLDIGQRKSAGDVRTRETYTTEGP